MSNNPSQPLTTNASAALAEGIALFNQQAFFECHEVLEDLWRPLPQGTEKRFLQGLIQLAVGFHHHQKQNAVGAKSLLASGLEKLNQNEPPDYAKHYDWQAVIGATQPILNALCNKSPEIDGIVERLAVIKLVSFPRITAL